MSRALHLAPHQTDTQLKALAREELDNDVAKFLAAGNEIIKLAHGERAPEVPVKRRGKAAKKPAVIFNPRFADYSPLLAKGDEEEE